MEPVPIEENPTYNSGQGQSRPHQSPISAEDPCAQSDLPDCAQPQGVDYYMVVDPDRLESLFILQSAMKDDLKAVHRQLHSIEDRLAELENRILSAHNTHLVSRHVQESQWNFMIAFTMFTLPVICAYMIDFSPHNIPSTLFQNVCEVIRSIALAFALCVGGPTLLEELWVKVRSGAWFMPCTSVLLLMDREAGGDHQRPDEIQEEPDYDSEDQEEDQDNQEHHEQ